MKTPTSITPRDIEALKPVGSESNVKDLVVQSKKGSGPISGPLQNFDGACLPFGPPCEQPSGCSCLPPDTNGEVGATQYVQMVIARPQCVYGYRTASRRRAERRISTRSATG